LLLIFGLVVACEGTISDSPKPEPWGLLSAPWTGFNSDGSINLAIIKKQAAFHKASGVTSVWAVGGMAQWATLTLTERKALAQQWVTEGQKLGLEIFIHVGHQCIADAIELAKHAESIGADGIALIPPFAPERPGSPQTLALILAQIGNSVSLPLYYYHIPGTTGVNFKMAEIIRASHGIVNNLAGAKYVSDDIQDFVECLHMDGGKYRMMWAPNPKLQALPFGAKEFVLAEAYYAPWLLDVLTAYAKGDQSGAEKAQAKLTQFQDIICCGTGKSVMSMFGIDLGPTRLPGVAPSQSQVDQVQAKLQSAGFFNKTIVF